MPMFKLMMVNYHLLMVNPVCWSEHLHVWWQNHQLWIAKIISFPSELEHRTLNWLSQWVNLNLFWLHQNKAGPQASPFRPPCVQGSRWISRCFRSSYDVNQFYGWTPWRCTWYRLSLISLRYKLTVTGTVYQETINKGYQRIDVEDWE